MTSPMPVIERFTSEAITTLTLIDRFFQLRGTGGKFPPPVGDLQFTLTARIVQGSESPLAEPIEVKAQTRGLGVFLFYNDAAIGSNARVRIPAGRYKLRIASSFYQDAVVQIDWPTDPLAPPSATLDPAYAYPFPDLSLPSTQLTLLRGNLFGAGGPAKPVSGATVTITAPSNSWPFATCITGADGGWVLAIPLGRKKPPFDAVLHFALPGGGTLDVHGVHVTPGEENSLRQTALRGAVLTTNDGPIANAVVTVGNIPGTSLTGRNGEWSFYMSPIQPDGQARVTATVPNGRDQSQDVQIRNGVTATVPAFRIPID